MDINIPTIITILVSFVVFMVAMKQVFFDPIARIKDAREQAMVDERNQAQGLLDQQKSLAQNYQNGLQDARKKAQELVQEFRANAKAKAQETLNQAREQANSHLDAQMLELAQWRKSTYDELRAQRQVIAEAIVTRLFPALEKTTSH